MKTIISLLIALFPLLMSAQKFDTVNIHTSSVCESCKVRIEKNLSFEKGVKTSNLDIDSKVVTVIYNPEKTTPEKIRIALTKIGYDADTLKADQKAFMKLPECCRDSSKHH